LTSLYFGCLLISVDNFGRYFFINWSCGQIQSYL
jgi:hypothetical protein